MKKENEPLPLGFNNIYREVKPFMVEGKENGKRTDDVCYTIPEKYKAVRSLAKPGRKHPSCYSAGPKTREHLLSCMV